MSDLVEFLLARIAEDEAAARAVRGGSEWQNGLPATIHPNPETYRTVVRQTGHVCGSIIAEDAEHIARWDPARVLAECAAKRQIMELHQSGWHLAPAKQVCDEDNWAYPCPTMRLLALPYAEHPDFREEWKP